MTSRITDRIASIGLPAKEKGRLAAALGRLERGGLVEVNAVGVLSDRNHLDDAPDWVGDQAESARDEQAELDKAMLLVTGIEVMNPQASEEEGEEDVSDTALGSTDGRSGFSHGMVGFWVEIVLLKVDAVGVLRDSNCFDDSPNPGGDTADAAGYDGDDQLNHTPAGVAGKEVVDAEMAEEHS